MFAGVLKKYRSTKVYKFIRSLQLHRPFIMYPLMFCAGAVFETAKIHWHPGGHNFYDTWRRRRLDLELKKFEDNLVFLENSMEACANIDAAAQKNKS